MNDKTANATSVPSPGDWDVDAMLRASVSRDFELLARLNDREPTAELIHGLRSVPSRDWFGVRLRSDCAVSACSLLDDALDAMPHPVDEAKLNELAADHAAIYLIHSYRAPPTESPWLDKDQLERQEPMFELAQWYRRYGLAAVNRQLRSDDHMVLQLQFLSHLFATPDLDMQASAQEAARFLDQHLLRWIGSFATRVASRCETPYYCGVATLTHAYLEEVRDILADRYALARPQPDEVPDQLRQASSPNDDEDAAPYVPGIAPSW